ncbi:MAG TPA: hypothetical protein VFD16_01410 [Candidatus Saccharimonadales bacterium]|nr:hypothetical protein [Candidatus Saccharimonadales bacterium]
MKNLFTWKYWFTVNPEPLTALAFKVLIAIIVLLLLAAIITAIYKRRSGLYRGVLKKMYNLSAVNFIIGLIILFFNYENVPFFASRMWLGFWVLEIIIWKLFIIKSLCAIPKKKKALEAEKELKKYLP